MSTSDAPESAESDVISYRYSETLDDLVRTRMSDVKGFAAEMREKGIHVGLGMPGVCVTCDQPWPCNGSYNDA